MTKKELVGLKKRVDRHFIQEQQLMLDILESNLSKSEKVDTWYNKGVVYSNLNRYDDGIICFEKALRFAEEKENVEEAEHIRNNLNLLKVKRVLRKRS